jgi:COP9 signalosome complex subunit 1
MKEVLMLDIHLRPHVPVLYEQIRQRALKQYVSPFMSVNLNKMAQAFNTTTQLLEKELAMLIMDGGIQARIDSHNKILYARRDNERVVTFEKAINTGREFVSETEANIRRLNMLRNGDFQVRQPRLQMSPSQASPSGTQVLAR